MKVLLWDVNPPSSLMGPLRAVLHPGPGGSGSAGRPGMEICATVEASEPRRVFARFGPDLVLLVLHRHGLARAGEVCRCAKQSTPCVPTIAIIEDGGSNDALEVLKTGATDFIFPPLRPDEVFPRIWRFLLEPGGHEAVPPSAGQRSTLRLLGKSPCFRAAVEKLPQIAGCDAGVLIRGETGTGKELFARAIHDLSPRASQAFVPINCGAIPLELAESELFGHERGAFTGAHAAHPGVLRQADGGTLFLDEVPSLPLPLQTKLLRFLQEKEFRPLGSCVTRQADVRVIAATNLDLHRAVTEGKFRQDLYYRLNVLPVTLPPLRERREDIALLAQSFLDRFARQLNKPLTDFCAEALEKLNRHDWPGNVRELEHVIERTVVFSTGCTVRGDDVDLPEVRADPESKPSFREAKAQTIRRFEREYLEGLLTTHQGNITLAARSAGKHRRAFWELMRKHRIEGKRFGA